MDITKIDKNFAVSAVSEEGYVYTNIKDHPELLEGLPFYQENGKFYRLPADFTENEINKGALELGWCTSGACVRFRSDSPEVTVRAKLHRSGDMDHMPRTGSAGFDCYFRAPGKKMRHNKTVRPAPKQTDITSLCGVNDTGKVCDWIINFPLYGGVEEFEIGIKEGYRLMSPKPHKIALPVAFYGSSITQGGCASRPGNMYSSMLCRAVDAPQINWGFSGCGRGEIAVAHALGKMQLSAFVMDYDHNAPTIEHLTATHQKFFQAVRAGNPDLPIVIVSRCDFHSVTSEGLKSNIIRRDIIKKTYQDAVDSGDKKVWFVDGSTLFGREDVDACTVDGCHPNDLGFYRMYKGILPALKKALGI